LEIFEKEITIIYKVNIPKSGVYLFLIEGEIEIDFKILSSGDDMAIIDFDQFQIKTSSKADSVNAIKQIIMDASAIIEIKDNTFARQFETMVEKGLVTVEYSFQEKKIFLTKINVPDLFDDEEFISNLLKEIMAIAIERKLKVVPILPKIVVFFKKNPVYKELLPPGIRL